MAESNQSVVRALVELHQRVTLSERYDRIRISKSPPQLCLCGHLRADARRPDCPASRRGMRPSSRGMKTRDKSRSQDSSRGCRKGIDMNPDSPDEMAFGQLRAPITIVKSNSYA